MSHRRSALRQLGDLLAPDGAPARTIGADLPDDVLVLAERLQLLPALRSSITAGGIDVDRPRLRQAHVRNLARNLALVDQVTHLLRTFDAAGIRAAPLKGIDAVMEELYDDWGARTMADLDVLVDPSSGAGAAEVLAALGYVPAGDELPGHHHLTPMAAPGLVGVVEIHIGLLDRSVPGFLDPGDVLGRANPCPGRPGLRLDRTDAATHLVDHAQHASPKHHVELDLRALHETALTVRRVPDVDWPLVRDRFARAGQVERFDAHLAAAEALLGVPAPVPLGRPGQWVARRGLFVDDHPVLRLVDRPGRSVARLRRERLERYYGTPLSGVGTWRARARFLGEVVGHHTGRGVRPPA